MIHILLSTYNGERYLSEQLDSIIAQTVADWRLFVRDDGSTDTTVQLLEKYAKADRRIRLITDGENIGACRSFERLLTQCGEADYYAFADQDDVWKPEKLAVCLDQMHRQEHIYPAKPIVVHTDLQVVDEHLHEIAPSFWRYSNIRPELVDANLRYLAICNSVTGCAMFFNRAARETALPFRETAYMHDAWVALSTAAAGGKVIPLSATPIAYRQHQTNVLGAVPYTLWGKTWAQRKADAQRSYTMAHPLVFANKAQFLLWKIIYFIHRQCA